MSESITPAMQYTRDYYQQRYRNASDRKSDLFGKSKKELLQDGLLPEKQHQQSG
jgi:hypothetical protein